MSAEDIAAKLTKAQREALLNGKCAVPRRKDGYSSDCLCGSGEACRMVTGEPPLTMPRERWPGGIILTPLGLAVRAILQGEHE